MRTLAATMTFLLLLSLGGIAPATDEPDELLRGGVLRLAKPVNPLMNKVRFRCLPTAPAQVVLPGSGNNPTVEGGTLRILDTGAGGGDQTFTLPTTNWAGLGNPAGAGGWVYTDTPGTIGACRKVVVRPNVVLGFCRATGTSPISLTPPFTTDAGVVLHLGAASKRYCCTFGGTNLSNTSALLVRKNAPVPASCAAP